MAIKYTDRSKVYDTDRAGTTSWQTLGEKPPTAAEEALVGTCWGGASQNDSLYLGRLPMDALIVTGGSIVKQPQAVLGMGPCKITVQAAPVEGGRPFNPDEEGSVPNFIYAANIQKPPGQPPDPATLISEEPNNAVFLNSADNKLFSWDVQSDFLDLGEATNFQLDFSQATNFKLQVGDEPIITLGSALGLRPGLHGTILFEHLVTKATTLAWATPFMFEDGAKTELSDKGNSYSIVDYVVVDNETIVLSDVRIVGMGLFSTPYLLFEANKPFTITVTGSSYWGGMMEVFTKDVTSWTEWEPAQSGSISVSSGSGKYIFMRGTGNSMVSGGNAWAFAANDSSSLELNVSGNLASLLEHTVWAPNVGTNAFLNMFYGCTALRKAPDIFVGNIAAYGFERIYHGCTNLRSGGNFVVNGSSVGDGAFYYMFLYCANLVEPPKIDMLNTASLGIYVLGNLCRECNALKHPPIIRANIGNSDFIRYLVDSTSVKMYLTDAPGRIPWRFPDQGPITTFTGSELTGAFRGLAGGDVPVSPSFGAGQQLVYYYDPS